MVVYLLTLLSQSGSAMLANAPTPTTLHPMLLQAACVHRIIQLYTLTTNRTRVFELLANEAAKGKITRWKFNNQFMRWPVLCCVLSAGSVRP